MVVTKIEAGKYSIVVKGMKVEAIKQRSHCWAVRRDGFVADHLATLKECKEWAEMKMAQKPAEPVKQDAVAETNEPADTEKADEPKSRVEKLMPSFLDGRIIVNMPTLEVCELFMQECVKRKLKWGSGALADDFHYRWVFSANGHACISYGIAKAGNKTLNQNDMDFYRRNYPSIPIVTLTVADFDKPKKEFTKADLKTGMVVEYRNGERFVVLRGEMETANYGKQELLLMNNNLFVIGANYNDRMENSVSRDNDIVSVYKPNVKALDWMLKNVSGNDLIWQRKPEYDWSKAEIDTPMLGKVSTDPQNPIKRHFAAYIDGCVYAWEDGATSFTAQKNGPWLQRMYDPMPYKGNEHLAEGEEK